MSPRMRTRSAGRPATESLGGGTGVRVGRGESGRRPREGNDERVNDLNGQGNDQGMGANEGPLSRHANSGCSYKEFLACNPKEYDGKRGAVVLTRWRKWRTSTKPKTMQKAVQILGALAIEAVRNGLIKKVEKRGNVGEPSKDKNGRDDNKRTRIRNVFATTVSPV
nr:reverse transcriptase domain-containing protein [Tanacetum cinerariifolium]